MDELLWTETLPQWREKFNGIDLWFINLKHTDAGTRYSSILTEEEKTASNRYIQAERHQLSITSRVVLRMILSAYLQSHPAEIEFRKGEYQKPYVHLPEHSLHFNISHTANLLLIGISRSTSIGVDMESVHNDVSWLQIANHYFTASERVVLQKSENPQDTFYRFWTAKEAFLKGISSGFHFPLEMFTISYTSKNEARVITSQPIHPPEWYVLNFPLPESCIGAVSIPEPITSLRCYLLNHNNLETIASAWPVR